MRKSTKEEAPVTVLTSWCLRWNKAKSSIVIFGRRLENGRLEERFWRTSSVVKAFTPLLVITRHKSIYSLVGELNWQQSNLDASILRMFNLGLPSNWKSILLENIAHDQREKEKCQQDAIYNNCSSVYIAREEQYAISSGIEESFKMSRYSPRERRKRGQTETEKLCRSLRYTGWQKTD
ncbi:hypothetical protein Gasu2_35250 [Galdieria sulphuraria]|uniref:SANTA domain-containing protein n=1 Tax=Galdieria sulphuraria TaxID=130081 RepID=M2XUW4_GALSU|nr:uncharacterized protein Gasu_50220 [Galdieria sulphuraria]EME27428.1 hypothetical protein Gasu_50220 [Galdieria sulphuraria]GJD09265.1 hypothetical protein Gasu2_35250 [Galdieria sulphuraria]|eukprot:XP_005703948.1 hypothetical protein Gasu_50220 [Galdieria sulphuraria]